MDQDFAFIVHNIEILIFSLHFKTMENYLDDYNVSSKAPMDLVLFRFAIEHISRVCRVLRQPNGHALLVGMLAYFNTQ